MIKLKKPFNVKLKDLCVLASLVKQYTDNNSDLFFAGFPGNTDIFLDLGSLGSQVTECIHVNLKPFCDKRPQITQNINAWCVQTRMTFTASCTQTIISRETERKQTRVKLYSVFIDALRI